MKENTASKTFELGVKSHKEKDYQSALKYFEAASDQGNSEAEYWLGSMYDSGHHIAKNEVKAIFWYKKAAEKGVLNAQYNLAIIFSETEVDYKNNQNKASYWFEKAAKQGHAESQYRMTERYVNAIGVNPNFTKSYRWCKKAAEQGMEEAQLYLAHIYHVGIGVTANNKKAFYWNEKAAEHNNMYAQYNAGLAYILGKGVGKDLSLAKFWIKKAIDNKHPDAKNLWDENELYKY